MICKYWHKFWFQKQSPLPIVLFRIFFGLFILQKCFMEFLPNLSEFYGVRPLIHTSTLCINWWHNYPLFNMFLFMPSDDLYRYIFFGMFVIVVLFMTIGFCTRLSTIIVYLAILSLDKQAPFTLNGSDDFMRLMSFLLIFSPAGTMLSVDYWLREKLNCPYPAVAAPWAQRMIQVQLSMAYFFSFICKVIGPQWQQGTAVYFVANRFEFNKFALPWLTNHAPYYQMLTYFTLATELSLATLVWYKPWRYWVLLAGMLMHMGIDWTMNLPYFEFLFVSCYLNFIEPRDITRLTNLSYKYLIHPIKKMADKRFNISRQLLHVSLKQSNKTIMKPKFMLNSHWQFPLLFITIMSILIAGSLAANPVLEKISDMQNKYNYPLELFKEQVKAKANLKLRNNLPENNEDKLNAEENLARVLSTTEDYNNAESILRHIIKYRLDQKSVYNPRLISTMSSLGDLYLELGRLEAAELCYQTILDYELNFAPPSSISPSIYLNNLAVVSYFRSLTSGDRIGRYLNLEKAHSLCAQGLEKLLSKNENSNESSPAKLAYIDILNNEYLILRDSCKLKEADTVRLKLLRLKHKFI